MLIKKIIFLVVILVIISLLFTQKEHFENSNKSNSKSNSDVFYKNIIDFEKLD